MLYMLDTDTSSHLIRGGYSKLDARVARTRSQTLRISAVTRAELLFGVQRKGRPVKLAALVARFLHQVRSLPWDDDAASRYAEVRATMERAGALIGNLDTMIAAQAAALEATLVTNNARHFSRVPDLRIENWTE